ncbi:MAG: tyrosine-type recombinase/integrase [Candidatus Aenigmarchaeota archaeon]|nr:tyrosine-type recombinase/integrase [Candidatus Aenigmarchaeota archaeon]
MDIHNFDKSLENISKRLEGLREQDRNDIFQFKRQLVVDNISSGRIMKCLYTLKRLSEMNDKPFRDCNRDDIVNLVEKIQQQSYTDWTKTDFKKILKKFHKWLRQTEEFPPEVKWIKTNVRNHKKLPNELLTKEEVERLANTTDNSRDKAFILTLYDSGCRIGEFLPLRIKDIIFDEYGCVILVSGKTGERRVRILDYSKELLMWLEDHPSKENPEAFVWCQFNKNNELVKYSHICRILNVAKQKTGITKKVNPHAFRHARASNYATQIPEQTIKKHFGWTNSSKMLDIYISVDDKQVDDALLKNIKGLKPKDGEIKKIETKICQKCNETNSILTQLCVKCGNPFNINILKEDEHRNEFDKFLKDFLVELAKKDSTVKKVFRQMVKERKLEYLFQN